MYMYFELKKKKSKSDKPPKEEKIEPEDFDPIFVGYDVIIPFWA